MKTFTIASFVALASVATAQLENIPSCALNCFVGPLTSDGCDSLTDFQCHCRNGPALLSSVQPCVQGACTAAEQQAAIAAVESTCAQAGVPINLPEASAAPSVAASAASSAVASASAAVSSVLSEIVASVSSAVATPVASTTVSTTATQVVVVPTPTPSSDDDNDDDDNDQSSAVVVAPTSTLAEFTGGAAQATHAVGIIGAAALAMLAL